MRISRRRLLVSTAVAIGLLVPAAAPAIAAPQVGGPQVGGRLSRLAAERDSGRVVIAVKVRPGTNGAAATLAAVAGSARAQGGRQRRTLPKLGTVTVEVPEATATAFTARMRGRHDVAKVEVVPRRSLSFIPNDERYPVTAPYLGAVSAPEAWEVHKGDPGVLIAVVDSGVDLTHPDLSGRVVETYNGLTHGTDVTDTVGHGTFVAGVAAATHDNGIGIAGASMGANILAVKVDDAGVIYADAVADGVIWAADHGAKVINLSMGSTRSSQVESDAVAYATGKNVLVVAAAGNVPTTTPSYPAAYPQVVAVGSTDAAGGRAVFSSFGPWVTVAAPGVNITGTTPTAGSIFFPSPTSGYSVGDGTSFSSPIVAAEAALLWSVRPTASASDVRHAIVKSSHGYTNLGLGTGQVDFRAAFDALGPDSVPSLTRPVNGATVTGVVQLSAASAAPKVRFSINGAPLGPPVATKAGVATTTWTSWGLANAPRTVTAVDCSVHDLCNTTPTQVGVTLANAAPALTSPRPSQILTGTATFTATASGGGVAFFVDGVRRGFDGTAPYSLPYSISALADGAHRAQARSCPVTGNPCAGPLSALVSFTAKSLHPRFTGVSPSAFSPNGDGRFDATKATYYLPDTQYVRFQVRNAAGTIVRGPSSLGTLGAGTRTLTWNGLLNSGVRAGNGAYTLELVTTRGTATGTLHGSAVAPVRLDVTAPTVWSITGSGATFYPYPDSYKDSFAPKFSLSEAAIVGLTVRTGGGTLVRNHVVAQVAGSTSIVWDGKNTAGARVAAGTYYWTLTAQDPAGNRSTSTRYAVIVNAGHLVTRTATLSLRGSQYFTAGGSAPCAAADTALSEFSPYGVLLANACDPSSGPQIAASTYRFLLPAAISYTSLRVDTYGSSHLAPTTLGAAFTRWATGASTFAPEITVSSSTNAWRTIGAVAPTSLVNGSRLVETTLYVPNDHPGGSGYDASYARLVVTYKVLA